MNAIISILKDIVEIYEDCGGTIESVSDHVVNTSDEKKIALEISKAIKKIKRKYKK